MTTIIVLSMLVGIQSIIILHLWRVRRVLRAQQAAAATVAASEQHFRLLAEASQDVIFRYDLLPAPCISYLSPAILDVTGFTADELYTDQTLWLSLVTEEDRARLFEIMVDPVRAREPVEVRWRRKDGSEYWAEARFVPIFDDNGQCVTVIGTNRDISARRRADEELRKLSRAVEQSSVSITITDAEGVIEYVNPHFTRVTGFTFEDVQGQKPRILRTPSAQESAAQGLLEAFRNGQEWRGELHNVTKTGERYWEEGVVSPLYDSDGKITHFLALLKDITQRKQQERERAAVLAVSLALRAADSSDEILAVVQEEIATTFDADKVFFVTPDEATDEMVVQSSFAGREFTAALDVHIAPGKGVAAQVYRTGQPYVSDAAKLDPLFAVPEMLGDAAAVCCVPLIAQGERLGLFSVARCAPFSSDDVRLLGALADMTATGLQRAAYHEATLRHAADLTRAVAEQTRELREANARLQELDQLKSKFVSDVSHELRTPVTNIVLYLKLFERKPEKQAKYLQILHEEAARLERLVVDTLDLMKLDNKPLLALSPVNLNELLQGVVDAHRAAAESRHLELTLEACEDLPVVMGDSTKLIQVATNLVANALNYTRAGYVRIRTTRQNGSTVGFAVEDTGVGIYAEDMPHLFERFYRGRRDQIADMPGTGLGLSIVEELVTLHNGTLALESEVGRGTTFTVSLPTTLHDA